MIILRNEYIYWLLVVYTLMSHEFSELIAEFLLVVKRWITWNLYHMITDDSIAKIKAFRLAFPSLAAGETEVSFVLLINYLLSNIPPS